MSDHEITVDQIAESFALRLERGERPTIEEYKKKYPELSDRIEAILPALLMLEGIESQPQNRKLAIDDSIPEIIGDYQVIQEVGRGGMGIVFEARHTHMRRRVALKVLPKSLAENSDYVSRFLTEARSAGQLHHTNIVPVFEIGEFEGLNFYAMQFIHGENLDRIIEDVKRIRLESVAEAKKVRPNISKDFGDSQQIALSLVHGRDGLNGSSLDRTDNRFSDSDTIPIHESNRLPGAGPRTESENSDSLGLSDSVFGNDSSSTIRPGNVYHRRVAAVGIQVAEALEYAHHNNVLHRDVKPANLILDTEGTVWITDFGLAKHDENLTKTGDIVGTLRYMAPERFNGQSDARSDVYSLGLTLYELCTLQCAFDGIDRASLLRDVHHRAPVRPRKIDKSIPFDLETIILKAIASTPERRYATAQELADDFRLFLADRPINARRVTYSERLFRVCRRNPVAATMTACIVTLLVVLSIVGFRYAWIKASTAEAEIATRKKNQRHLFESKVDQARLIQRSNEIGHRFESLDAIRDAVHLLPDLDMPIEEKKETLVDLRNQAISALSLTDVANQTTFSTEGHWGSNRHIAFNDDRTIIAEGNIDGRVRIRHLEQNKDSGAIYLTPQESPSRLLKLSPDGRFLGVTHYEENSLYRDVELFVWDLQNPEDPVLSIEGVVDFDFSDNSQWLAYTIHAGNFEIYSLNDQEVTESLTDDFLIGPRLIRFSTDAQRLVVSGAGEPTIYVWSVENRPERIGRIEANDNITAMDWQSDQSVLITGSRHGDLSLWLDDLSGPPVVRRAHQDEVNIIHIHPKKMLAATESIDGSIRINNLASDEESLQFEGFEMLLATGFAKDGTIGHFAGETQTIGFWKVAESETRIFPNATANSIGKNVMFVPGKNGLIARATNFGVEFWSLSDRRLCHEIESRHLKDFCLSPDGSFVLTCGLDGIDLWNIHIKQDDKGYVIENASPKRLYDDSADQVTVDSSGRTIVVGGKFEVLTVDRNGDVKNSFGAHTSLTSLEISADDRLLFSGTQRNRGVRIWDLSDGKPVNHVLKNKLGVSVSAHPLDPNRFLTAGRIVRQWDRDGWMETILSGELRQQNSIARYSPDGSMLAYLDRNTNLVVCDADSGLILATLVSVKSSRIVDFCFSPNSSKIAVSCMDNVQVFDLDTVRDQLEKLGLNW